MSIKLALAAAPPADVSRLARGTMGMWAGALGLPEEPLSSSEVQALWELLAREAELPKHKRSSITPRAFVDGLIAYRNRVLGHGTVRRNAFYEQAADLLLAALGPVWQAAVFLPPDATLLFCEAIVLGPDGSRLGRLLELTGTHAVVRHPRGSPVPESLLPRRMYLLTPGGWRDLHPWLLYREGDAADKEGVYCFNGLGPTLAEYLDYASGETLRNESLEESWPGILARLRELFPRLESLEPEPILTRDARRIGDYTVLGKLGEGGMGVVYLAQQEPLGRLVALKTLPAERGADPVALARFQREVQALARSEHPSVVKILTSGKADGILYYAMEYVEGADLERVAKALSSSDDFDSAVTSAFGTLRAERKDLFGDVPDVAQPPVEGRRGRGRFNDLARFFRDAARGLHHLHEKGVVHRDVKPANLMVTAADRRAVVMDLGVAALEGGTLSISHDQSRIIGTLRYMAPEQLQRNLLDVDRRADVYSLGASLYELLCDRPFFDGDSEARLIQQVLKEEPRQIDRKVPDDLVRIVRKATDKDPARRYWTAEALAEDLENYLAGRPIAARDPEIGYLLRKWIARNRGLAVAGAAAVISLVAGLVTSLAYARIAQREATRADDLKGEALVREAAATERADALWAIEELKHFKALDDDLEYARSQDRPAYVWWLEQAHELVDGRAADRARNLREKPSLEDHRRLLERIRREGRPPTEAEIAADRATDPKAKELEWKRTELQWTSRMLELEPWPSEAEAKTKLASDGTPIHASSLNKQAWRLVDPDARVFGRELEALALARRAVELTSEEDRSTCRETLAWALLWAGKIDEALSEERDAIEDAPQAKRANYEDDLRRMETTVQSFRAGAAAARREALAAEVSELETVVAERRVFRFDDPEKEWWNAHLSELVQDLEELQQRVVLAERSVSSPEAMAKWNEAIEAIACSEKYGGLRITPQLELLPLGADRDSGLWEFAHLATGEPPARGNDGKLVLKPETGMVFVLLPSGRVPVEDGADSTPLNEVQLDPFFLSKYEMTVAQWKRTSRWTGAMSKDEPQFPANNVSWYDCVDTLARAGLFLCLPTEAQWEYGCRAEKKTLWWTGATEDTLEGAANVQKKDGKSRELEPVGRLAANPFGLHDVHGNALEWCRDEMVDDYCPVRPGDGERRATGSGSGYRVSRGGSYSVEAALARSGIRRSFVPAYRYSSGGLRPARSVTP